MSDQIKAVAEAIEDALGLCPFCGEDMTVKNGRILCRANWDGGKCKMNIGLPLAAMRSEPSAEGLRRAELALRNMDNWLVKNEGETHENYAEIARVAVEAYGVCSEPKRETGTAQIDDAGNVTIVRDRRQPTEAEVREALEKQFHELQDMANQARGYLLERPANKSKCNIMLLRMTQMKIATEERTDIEIAKEACNRWRNERGK